jgi:hypothetical protein
MNRRAGLLAMIVGWQTGRGDAREAVRQLADLRRRLAAAEDAVTDAPAAMKQAEEAHQAALPVASVRRDP